ncbi:hypothetical protein FA13DRAFT_1712688 [Coprinellus micaceus]|uniref:Uncharacterized protein n=1 Tax=Coprinellus micaceus TaxID=71717 RepID=A0A4Y7SZP0_COPMI|nr:hypothetical protein FA13DRAFT_1712688 [Coprinellus micaceus]
MTSLHCWNEGTDDRSVPHGVSAMPGLCPYLEGQIYDAQWANSNKLEACRRHQIRPTDINRVGQFSRVALGVIVAWAWKWDYAALVVLSHLLATGEKAAQIIIRSRLCFLLAPFLPAEDLDAFFDLLFATGGAVVGDLAHRLTSSYNTVFHPTFDQCPTSYNLVVIVCNRLSMLFAVRWFEQRGYTVWRGVHVMGGQGMPGTNFLVGACTVEDLSTGISVSIAYGEGVRTCGMPCIPSPYISIITPAKIYRTLPSSGDISEDKKSGIQVFPWTENYRQDAAGFLFYTIRDSLLYVTRPHNCWDQDCPQRSDRSTGSMNMWLDCHKIEGTRDLKQRLYSIDVTPLPTDN